MSATALITAKRDSRSHGESRSLDDTERLLFTTADAASQLQVRESWLRERVQRREVAHTRLGKHVRFTRAQIEEIIARGQQPTASVAPGNGLQPSQRRRRHH